MGKEGHYGDDPFSPFHTPKKAFFMYGESERTRKDAGVKMITRQVPLPNGLKDYHAITARDLSILPHTKAGDKVYELTEIFPNCVDRAGLWVVYNNTSGYLIANADLLLKSSVNEYALRYVQDQAYEKLKLPRRLNFSLTYIEVDGNVPLDLESLNKADKVILFKQAGEVRVNEKYKFSNEQINIKMNCILDESDRFIINLLDVQGRQAMMTSSHFRLGEVGINEVGISEGNRKKLLISECSLNLLTGETLIRRRSKSIDKLLDLPIGVEDMSELLSEPQDLFVALGADPRTLVVPPEWMQANEETVVYDHANFLLPVGFHFKEDEWLLQNYSTGKYYLNASPSIKVDLEDLMLELRRRKPSRIEAVAIFYAIDSIENPSFLTRSGERSFNGSLCGSSQIEPIFCEDALSLDYALDLDLSLLGRDIKDSIKRKTKGNSVEYIELEREVGEERIVMRLVFREKKMKYSN